MIMIELGLLKASFQLLVYIYNIIFGMSREDVGNVLPNILDAITPGVFLLT